MTSHRHFVKNNNLELRQNHIHIQLPQSSIESQSSWFYQTCVSL